MVIAWSVFLGAMYLGGLLGEHFLTPPHQSLAAALGGILLLNAYAWVGPHLCTLELRRCPGQRRAFG
jgi:hypothetical protein